ncbi:MAG: bifunctional UDP-N-acetylglucosamine diphosphorylase/glucosamine-1-phosphate N-acetyltransferase GlmU [Bryobacteraceae bacterium]|nr:bifunctional UDP-N-acetylglucosamine diphosphorylase/glucosamine-1-phosphate N-acetyltransferase GlmU [Bryobacteraceae bacterium]
MHNDLSMVILAAGMGTRMKSKLPKVLHQAGGLPIVAHVAQSALALAPPERVVVVTGHGAEEVEAYLSPYKTRFARQAEQKGTGHALMVAADQVQAREGLLVVLYGDCPLLSADTITRLLAQHAATGAAATVITALLDDPTGYGRMILDAEGNCEAIVEQKAATPAQLAVREINSGIYCFNAPLLWRHLAEITPNAASGEIYLTDMIEILRRHGHRVKTLRVADPAEILGINTRLELAQADRYLRDRKAKQLMLEGVTLERPETITLDKFVEVGPDTIVESFVHLRGNTRIGRDCRIGTGCVLTNATLADGVVLHPYCVISDSEIATHAHLGPFARLRMQAQVEAGAHVGNFVELKKTRLGKGAKASHLAYLGDAKIGAEVNIGAGTITCNYDGQKKHATIIGEGAFIGSNSTLVAPVEIGENAYVAAGSVITENVPASTLALGRARQVVKTDWKRQPKRK